MFRRLLLPIITILMFCCTACSRYKYETVDGDPTQTRIYMLNNGLKVYMSVNKQMPRIQTYIAVKVGSKNDPAETTGLAHYFEHLMFKGTSNFGTSNYQAERPLLDRIEQLFEQYRRTSDNQERQAIYHRIDSISYEASKYMIPNEYDRLMATIGATGTNAYTTTDMTVYEEDIPSNQIENWAMIQADRFKNPVIRGFHTELETIYEEKNMMLTNDGRKLHEAIDAALFPKHPYGTQSVLGSQEHLKNPSITNVRNYHATYYVPNNMAICLSGDFDPDKMIAAIGKYFGDMKPNDNLPKPDFGEQPSIKSPITREVYGLDAASTSVAWRTGGVSGSDADMAELASNLLYNGKAGLVDIDINQQQKTLGAIGGTTLRPDHGRIVLSARPKKGQTLEQVRDLLLKEAARLRNGEFDEKLLAGTVNNYKARIMKSRESNEGRADLFVQSFINGTPWSETVHQIDNIEKITKEEVVAWARENLRDDNYAVIYKRQGHDPNEQKITKPAITPIVMNRDAISPFVAKVQASEVKPIKPVFIDFQKEISVLKGPSGLDVFYKHNETNGLFTLTYLFETGAADNPDLNMTVNYLRYLDTPTWTAADRSTELYDIACSFSLQTSGSRSQVTITGLDQYMDKAMELFEDLIRNAQPNESILENLKSDLKKARENAKLSQQGNFAALQNLLFFGPEYIRKSTMSDQQIEELTSEEMLSGIRRLTGKRHRILYYGPKSEDELLENLTVHHNVGANPEEISSEHLRLQLTPENEVYILPYGSKQLQYMQLSNRGETYAQENDPAIVLYNEYFSGSMNSIVFQEMREARGLAYTARASLLQPSYLDTNYGYYTFIATQNDKLRQAIEAFCSIIEQMPESQAAFNTAKEAVLARLRTDRTINEQVLWSYVSSIDLGLGEDRNKYLFEKIRSMTLNDVKRAHEKWVKGRKYRYGVIGNTEEIDMQYLETLGPVRIITPEEAFGY